MVELLAQGTEGLVGGGIIAGVLIGMKIVERWNGKRHGRATNNSCGYGEADRERDRAAMRTLERIATILDKLEERIK